ncbi:hypothetical protein DH2020_045641 [Rehmannia glutinosa]|uniref:Retrovirus-related Pol polyprotein from transposon TNT 1-94-like beta-barrel domain-containing protein n=1 Tax=Rehmannia glutinosa TaxID=99300 RepID=A0ABR0UDL3_REHGL
MAATGGTNLGTTNEPIIQPQSQLVTVKLNESNHLVWKQQIWAAIRGYGLEGYLTGLCPMPDEFTPCASATEAPKTNPSYLQWNRQDQLLASWLLSALSESILITTVGLNTSKEIWDCLKTTFANQNQAKVMQYRLHLQTLKKGNLQMKDYLNKIKSCCDLLGSAGEPVSQKDQVMYVLSGLGPEYNSVMVSATSRLEPWSLSELHALLRIFENRLETFESRSVIEDGSFSVNFTQNTGNRRGRGNHTPRGRGYYHNNNGSNNRESSFNANNRGRGRFGGARGKGGRFGGNGPRCQICHYNNNTAERCFYRADLHFTPNSGPNSGTQQQQHNYQQSTFGHSNVNVARISTEDASQDLNWYPDSGATNHVTYDMGNHNIASDYQGNEKVQVGNGQGLNIAHFGNSIVVPPDSDPHSKHSFLLKNLLHVPHITKNLISVSQFAQDNHVFFEFNPSFCLVKDQCTGNVLLQGALRNGLYSFSLSSSKSSASQPSFSPTNKHSPGPLSINYVVVRDSLSLDGLVCKDYVFNENSHLVSVFEDD